MNPLMKFFVWNHLPNDEVKAISKACADLANLMDALPASREKSAGFRKLLEAKDCFVRAKLEELGKV